MGREFELKYRADSQKIEEIQKKYGSFSSIAMQTLYYDTPSRDFGRRRWTLRRRLENGSSVCTLKTPLPDGSRGEWEVAADTMEAGLELLCKLDVPEELAALAASGLVPTCGAKFTRLAAALTLDEAVVELALDRGCLLGGGRELPLWEVEVELKSGREAAAIGFARQLAEEFQLVPEGKSKQQRALELMDN